MKKTKTSFSSCLSRSTRQKSADFCAHSPPVGVRESPLETRVNEIFVFGNADLICDSLPLKILPTLTEKFPEIEFVVVDPNEDWDVPEEVLVIDTAVGIKDVTVFDDLKKFQTPPRVGMHDFDALTNLRYLQKLGKIKKIKIIAVPSNIYELEAIEKITDILQKI